jgi:hypothetical protein
MIFLGLDDTDTRETPGTNKLAMHLADLLSGDYETQWIVRHQLLEDPRVPCTNKNGCASLALEPRGRYDLDELAARIRAVMIPWCPVGSDPGLCLTENVPPTVCDWGRRAQRELLTQSGALELARETGMYLAPLGGTGDGVVGALAAVGLLATWNSGRVVYRGSAGADALELGGRQAASDILARGVDEIVNLDDRQTVRGGTVELAKRLRPNLRSGRAVLYVTAGTQADEADWIAQRITA